MVKQRGYMDMNFGGFFIALILFGVLIGIGGMKLVNYLANHVDVEWVEK